MSNQPDYEALLFLLKAPKRTVVEALVNGAFRTRNEEIPEGHIEQTSSALQIEKDEAERLLRSLKSLVKLSFYQLARGQKSLNLFPEDFHQSLKELLATIITNSMIKWREVGIEQQLSLPRLIKTDWRIDITSASEASPQLSVPTVLVELQVEEERTREGENKVKSVNFELDKETLQTMLAGLGKIRDQLNSLQ